MRTSRYLDYCGVCSICGAEIADEIFERKLPPGFDLDEPGDEALITQIVAEALKCEQCAWNSVCFSKPSCG